ncbi:MAG: hypothetical protein QXW41_07535 [Fervidicoccaceae archaeon]
MVRRLEDELRYWQQSARVLSAGAGSARREVFERVSSVGQLAVGALQVVNILNLLQLHPSFWLFLERVGEIWRMPPELVRLMYPELFYGSIVAMSTTAVIHTTLQWVYMSVKKQAIPLFKGLWRAVYVASLTATLAACIVAFIVAKSPLALTYMVLLSLALPYALNPRYDEVIEEVNKLVAAGE